MVLSLKQLEWNIRINNQCFAADLLRCKDQFSFQTFVKAVCREVNRQRREWEQSQKICTKTVVKLKKNQSLWEKKKSPFLHLPTSATTWQLITYRKEREHRGMFHYMLLNVPVISFILNILLFTHNALQLLLLNRLLIFEKVDEFTGVAK